MGIFRNNRGLQLRESKLRQNHRQVWRTKESGEPEGAVINESSLEETGSLVSWLFIG